MRRYGYILLFLLVLVAPFVVRLGLRTSAPASTRAGTGPRLIVFTPHNQDIRREFATAFARWHERRYGTPVVMDYRTIGGTNDIKRQLESMYRTYRQPDGSLKP